MHSFLDYFPSSNNVLLPCGERLVQNGADCLSAFLIVVVNADLQLLIDYRMTEKRTVSA